MNFREYLDEAFHINYVKKNVGEKLAEKFELPVDEVMKKIKDADPTEEKYLMFAATAWLDKRKEDIETIKTQLHRLHALGKVKTKDSLNLLNLVEKNKTDLLTITKFNKQHDSVDTTTENKLENYEKIVSVDGIDVYEVDKFVCVPGSNKHELFHKTSLCVQKQDMFDHYKPPYFLFVRGKELVALYHIKSNQFMDVDDDPISDDLKEQLFPAFIKLLKLKNITKYSVKLIKFIPKDKRFEVVEMLKDGFEELAKKDLDFLNYIPKDKRFEVVEMLKDGFEELAKTDPVFLYYLPDDKILQVVEMFKDSFKELAKTDHYFLDRIPKDKRFEVVEMFKYSFKEQAKTNHHFLDRIPKDKRFEVVEMFKDSFKELAKTGDYFLNHIPDDEKLKAKSLLGLEESVRYRLVNYLL